MKSMFEQFLSFPALPALDGGEYILHSLTIKRRELSTVYSPQRTLSLILLVSVLVPDMTVRGLSRKFSSREILSAVTAESGTLGGQSCLLS